MNSITNDITARYEKAVSNCLNRLVPLQIRFKVINSLNNAHFKEVGKILPKHLVNLLSAWCVKEFYMDRSTNKVAITEHPFLSVHQFKRRMKREIYTTSASTIEVLAYHKDNNTLCRDKKGAVADA